jgi:hypothetical protein
MPHSYEQILHTVGVAMSVGCFDKDKAVELSKELFIALRNSGTQPASTNSRVIKLPLCNLNKTKCRNLNIQCRVCWRYPENITKYDFYEL